MLNKNIESKINEYMKDLNTNEPTVREIVTDIIIENEIIVNESDYNASVILVFENEAEDPETNATLNLYFIRIIQILGENNIAVMRDVIFNHEKREVLFAFNDLDYELTCRFYEEKNDKMFFENIGYLFDMNGECNVLRYSY